MITVDGLTLREIAEKSGVPLETVRHRYSRGLHTMEELTYDLNLHNNQSRAMYAVGDGKRFLEATFDKGLTLEDVSKRSGIGRSTIWSFVYDGADISHRRLAKLCGVVGVSMDYVSGLTRRR